MILLLSVDFLNPEAIIQYGGLFLLLLIIYVETGLFFGFFLPGDSLLFIAGLMCDSVHLPIGVVPLMLLLVLAASAGTTTGYGFGRWTQAYFHKRKENFFYKRKYLEVTKNFYRQYGMMAFIVGRFLPVVRTFIPILAGMVRINFTRFLFFNFFGAIVWIVTLVMAGYLLGNAFPSLTDHLEIIIITMVTLTSIPVVISWWKHKRNIGKIKRK